MAMNFLQLLRVGRRVSRLVRRITDVSDHSSSSGSSSGNGPQSSAPGSDAVADYPGDHHGDVQFDYEPVPGAEAGPGEVVWTWVPFEELDGRGKDRPVLIIGRQGEYLLGLQLTTRDRNNHKNQDADYIDIGAGSWDSKGRPSEAQLDRVLQINPRDIRREGGVVSEDIFLRVEHAAEERRQ